MKIPFFCIPEKIRTQYNLYSIVGPDCYVYCEFRKGLYGLKQAARLAFDDLVKLLAPHGYLTVQEISRFMEKSDRTHSVYPLCCRFWYQIQCQGGRTSPHQFYQKYFKFSIDW